MENNGKTITTIIVLGLASAGTIMTIANMQKGTLTNAGIILGAIVGPAAVVGLKKYLR